MLSDVHTLAGEIGPRGAGSAGEKAAADFVAARLSRLGLAVQQQTFRAVSSQNVFPLAVDLIPLLAVAIYPLSGATTRWLAAALALTTAPLLYHAIIHSDSPLRPLLPQVTSRNVVVRLDPRGEIRQDVVVLAHLDTNRCRLAWQSSLAQSLEPLTFLTLAMLAFLGVLYVPAHSSARGGHGGFRSSPRLTCWALSSRCGGMSRRHSVPVLMTMPAAWL